MNHGKVPQYYVEGHHEPIISPKTFDEAQAELAKRKGCGRRWSGVSVFSGKIICEECGGFYGPKVWHSTDKYRKVVWQCNNRYRKGKKRCSTPHIDEEKIKSLFLEAMAILFSDKEVFISNLEELRKIGEQPENLQTKVDALSEELEGLADKVKKLIQENAKKAMGQTEYDKKYNRLISRYEKKEQELQNMTSTLAAARAKNDAVDAFVEKLRNMDYAAEEFDENLWGGMVDSVVVHKDGSVTFQFKGGATVDVK
jgi:site-specific DNA recombinase